MRWAQRGATDTEVAFECDVAIRGIARVERERSTGEDTLTVDRGTGISGERQRPPVREPDARTGARALKHERVGLTGLLRQQGDSGEELDLTIDRIAGIEAHERHVGHR